MVKPEFEKHNGETIIKAVWAEEAFREFIGRKGFIADETDPDEIDNLREAFAAGWYSSIQARKVHGFE